MKFTLTVGIEWDREQEELGTFRKRYEGLKTHMETLQLQGVIPRGDLRWVITTAKHQVKLPPKPDDYDDPDDDNGAGMAVHLPHEPRLPLIGSCLDDPFVPHSPMMVHFGGNRLM